MFSLALLPAVKQRAYVGCAQHLARHLLTEVQPPLFSLLARQLLHLLRAHEAAATFQAAALQLVQAHSGSGGSGEASSPARGMPTPQASMLVAEATASLQTLADLLAKQLDSSSRSAAGWGVPARAAPSVDPLPALLDAVASRRVLPLLAALLHVPAAHRAALEAAAPAAAAAQQAAVLAMAMAQQLGMGGKSLLAVLASSRGGRRLLLSDAAVLEQLLLATDAGCLAVAWQPAPGAEGAALLQHLAAAEAAVAQLCSAPLDSEAFAAASETAAALVQECGPTGRLALVQALALRASDALPRLLLMLRMHCALLRAACGTGAAACPETGGSLSAAAAMAELQRQYEPDFQLLLAAAPACAPAAQLIMALLRVCHPGALAAWQQQGVSVQIAAAAELRQLAALPVDAAGAVGGLGAARAALASIKGAVAAVMTAQQERGLPSLLTFLGAELPQLGAAKGAGASSPRSVRWEDVELLFWWVGGAGGLVGEVAMAGQRPAVAVHGSQALLTPRTQPSTALASRSEPEKLACCEQCLRLLAGHLWAPGAAGRATAYTADAQEGLAVLLRALLTGCELVEASAADDSWQVGGPVLAARLVCLE